jgi:hypothetical protein
VVTEVINERRKKVWDQQPKEFFKRVIINFVFKGKGK